MSIAEVERAARAAYEAHKSDVRGEVATYIPELAKADPDWFSVVVATVEGEVFTFGDSEQDFSIQSVCKPLLFGRALDTLGRAAVLEKVGVEPTGDAFNSIVTLEEDTNKPHNPMVNAGAIAVSGLLADRAGAKRVTELLAIFREFAGRDDIHIDMPVFLSERTTGDRNRAIAHLMRYFGMIGEEVDRALELYFQACSVSVTCTDLALAAATLAKHGEHPKTGARVLSEQSVDDVLSVMTTCGMYDDAGRFAYEVGLPAKSGVSGGLMAVVPGRLGIGVFSPRLDERGNSVRGFSVLADLAEVLTLHRYKRFAMVETTDLKSALTETFEASQPCEGEVAQYIPQLSGVDPTRFGLAAMTTEGERFDFGETDSSFTIQAAANPFALALALERHGEEAVLAKVDIEPSGNPFHAIELTDACKPFNPLGNAGAIAIASMASTDPAERLHHWLEGAAAFAGGAQLSLDAEVLLAEQEAGARNRAMAYLMRNFGVLDDVEAALELYFQQCSTLVTLQQLATMGATLAAGGRCPITGAQVVSGDVVCSTLSVTQLCGMHDASGRFTFDVGWPAKSGVSGAIVTVVPGRFGAAVFSPVVQSGNSLRGMALLRDLKARLGLRTEPAHAD